MTYGHFPLKKKQVLELKNSSLSENYLSGNSDVPIRKSSRITSECSLSFAIFFHMDSFFWKLKSLNISSSLFNGVVYI